MAKKKKQLKPIARGFATTSVPKKVVPVEEEPEPLKPEEPSTVTPSAGDSASAGAVKDVTLQAPQENKLEAGEQLLQNIVDTLQEKVEKEITRAVKAIEVDRRYSQTLPALELHPTFEERILQLALECESTECTTVTPVEEPEDKALNRLAITYGVLRRLGFAEDRVEQCLRTISGIGLEDAYDWLYMHCDAEELEDTTSKPANESRMSSLNTPTITSAPSTPRTPAQFMMPTTPSHPIKKAFRFDAQAAVFVPSSRSSPATHSFSLPQTPPILDLDESYDASDAASNSSENDDLSHEYARLRIKLADALAVRGPQYDASLIRGLRAKLETLKRDYLFDEREAEAVYQAERSKADAAALHARLTNIAPPPEPRTPKAKPEKHRPPELQHPEIQPPPSDIFEGDNSSDEDGIGLLDILEELPATTTTNTGTTVKVFDMALPKHWSGRTPKKLLHEVVSKIDKYAVISYKIISGATRVKRALVNIRWNDLKANEWAMEDVACHDDGQAEQYIATIALHSLSYPTSQGFASGASIAPGSQSFFRLLPAIYRDLWDELEAARKVREDSVNRQVWAKLKEILSAKLETSPMTAGKDTKTSSDAKLNTIRRQLPQADVRESEQIMMDFQARVAGPSYQEMLVQRNTLPIAQYRHEILRVLDESQVLVLSGETGCGKSTQVPTFILEDQLSQGKPCKIFCTEPRRISAISLAQRVSKELGEPTGAVGSMASYVGYSIRLESNTSRNTRLTFVTNGIALRMLESGTGQGGQGTAFDDITHIIIDEVHERTIESDFLLIVLKSLLEQRADLKIILMSATVDAEKISDFFGGCPTLQVPGRTFPVDVFYLEDAVQYTGWAVTENSPYARRQNDKFYRGKNRSEWSEDLIADEEDSDEDAQQKVKVKLEKRYSANTTNTINLFDERLIPYDLIMLLLEKMCFEDVTYQAYSAAILIFMPGLGEIRRMNDILLEHPLFGSPTFKIYPLHSTLSSESQGAVFDVPPPGIRKIVIATNIAETGITIPDITCVIDSGKHREMRFDEKRQISRLVETFIAKSNAAQRRGRAGRVQQGLCFHIFTKLRHDTQMADHPLPEMMRLSLSDLALRIKIMRVKLGSSIEDVLSRALDPPVAINVQRAVSALVEVRALTPNEEITPMGKLLSKLPTDVHLGKFLLIATLFRCLDPALTIAATLNAKSPFVTPFGLEQEADRAKLSFKTEDSDFLTIHNVFSAWRRASANSGFVRKFCKNNFLSHQNLQQIEDLRQQFLGYLVDSSFIQVDRNFIRELSRARGGRGRTRFITVPAEFDCNSGNHALVHAALVAGLYPRVLSVDPSTAQMRTISNNQSASFHPSSVNFRRRPTDLGVHYLSYFTLMQSKRLYAWETGPADDLAMLLLCGEAEFKLISDSAFIDRKIKLRIAPKSNIALKFLRTNLASLLATQFRGKILAESHILWKDLSLMVLGKVRPEDEDKPSIMIVQ
ncbi:hypothetical protein HGRIS_007768 [Hohenbuehelia grisea]|uniref:P-loop containing nucleoside triphosphate hydrolase protein n=1 Tax=Hohenbuehelia grisea TaxID=104357 RepID=A0ABR3J6A3_9AGAR